MNTNKTLMGGIAGGVAFFLLGVAFLRCNSNGLYDATWLSWIYETRIRINERDDVACA